MKRYLALCGAIVSFWPLISWAGVDLTWTNCALESSSQDLNYVNCSTQTRVIKLYASFKTPVSLPNFSQADLAFEFREEGAVALDPFWRFDGAGTGGCNQSGLAARIDADVLGSCSGEVNPWGSGGSQGLAIIAGYQSPWNGANRGRLLVSLSRTGGSPFRLDPGVNYYLCNLNISSVNRLTCTGCGGKIAIVLTSVTLRESDGHQITMCEPEMLGNCARLNGAGVASCDASCYHTVIAGTGGYGTINPSGSVQVPSGGSQSFTITPNAGFHVTEVVVDGSSLGPQSSYTFSNVLTDHTIAASFAINTYTITANASAHGAITPSGVVTVYYGDSQGFAILADLGYQVAEVVVDGVSVGAVTSYTFSNVTANHTIAASFVTAPVEPKRISWNCWPGTAAAASTINFDCSALHFYDLVVTFTSAVTLADVSAINLELYLRSETPGALAPFWRFDAPGCNPSGLSVSCDPNALCGPTPWHLSGAMASVAGFQEFAPGEARILVTVASPTPAAPPVAGQTSYVCHLTFNTSARGSCAGCSERVSLELISLQLSTQGGAMECIAPGRPGNIVTINGAAPHGYVGTVSLGGDVAVAEGDAGTHDVAIDVNAGTAFLGCSHMSVDYATADGTAVAGADYLQRSGTRQAEHSGGTLPVLVPIVGDQAVEGDETFSANLSNCVGCAIGDGQALVTILNDDQPADVGEERPRELSLSLVGANPATGLARFRIGLPAPARVKLSIHDVSGRCVATLAEGVLDAGYLAKTWDSHRAASGPGVYYCRLVADDRVLTRRFIVLR